MASSAGDLYNFPKPDKNAASPGTPKVINLMTNDEPPPIDPSERLSELSRMLSNPQLAHQHANITSVIEMYKSGRKMTASTEWWFLDGKYCEAQPEVANLKYGSVLFVERIHFQLMQTPAAMPALQLANASNYGMIVGQSMHKIPIRLRLVYAFGGDPSREIAVSISNDTGSNTQTLYQDDLTALGFNASTYRGIEGDVSVQTANGTIMRTQIWVEIKVLGNDHTTELTKLDPRARKLYPTKCWSRGCPAVRLSGKGIRDHLYFATAPGNQQLFVAQKKSGIVSQLPVV